MSLALAGVTKAWDGVAALTSLSLSVQQGELLALVGPSGSGKSTALRVIAGLEQPDAGTVRIGDRDVTAVEASQRRVAMVFQSFALFPHLTAEENIGFGLRARGTPRPEARERAREVAGPLGLTDLLARRPAQLSGGERQRVALARALAGRPAVLLLDEPLSNLDARLRAEARAEIRRVQEATGVTTVHVTHDQDEALALGHRVAVLDRGTLQQIGTPDEVYDEPATVFVASFVGDVPMNLVDPAVLGLQRVGVVAGFRAEHVRLTREGVPGGNSPSSTPPSSTPPPLAVSVASVERAGHEWLVRVLAGGTEVVARVAADPPAPGEQARMEVERVLWFDGASGERVSSAPC